MNRRVDVLALGLFPLIVFGVLISTGNLTTGPRMVDDNQIYKLQIEFEESGFFKVLADELSTRWGMRRLFPVFCVHKVVLAKLFGGNLIVWSTWAGVLGVITGALLFCFLRLCDFSTFEALAFSLITILGEQSVLWWRLVHGEGIGMAFLSAALVCMALRIKWAKYRYEIAFSALFTLAMLCKESFILTAPAIVLLKIWLTCECRKESVRVAVKESLVSTVWLGVACAAALATIKYAFATTEFIYAGWSGFDLESFILVGRQYLSVTNAWCLAILSLMLLVVRSRSRRPQQAPAGSSPGEEQVRDKSSGVRAGFIKSLSPLDISLLVVCVFWLLMTLPQLLLYMKTGILNFWDFSVVDRARYIVPCILGYALLVAQMLRLIRLYGNATIYFRSLAVGLVCLTLAIKGGIAWRDGEAFAAFSRVNDSWFESIVENTKPTSPIVLVYYNHGDGGDATQEALRAYYILRKRHGRTNIFFCPFPFRPTIEEGRRATRQADTRRHAKKMRSVDQLPDPQSVDAVLIVNPPRMIRGFEKPVSFLMDDFFQNKENWLNVPRPQLDWTPDEEFRRVVHPHAHINYYRIHGK